MMRFLVACGALVLAAVSWAAPVDTARVDTARVVILRGTLARSGTTPLAFVADERSLDRAQLSGVSGGELLALKGQRLLDQAEFYRQAQRAAGVAEDRLRPLYVVLDPAGTWAYATPWATIRYERDGTAYGPVTSPMLLMGEKMDHAGQAVTPGEETAAANAKLLAEVKAFYGAAIAATPGGKRRVPELERDVLDRWTITPGGGRPAPLSKVGPELTSDVFLRYVKQAVRQDLAERGADPKAFDAFVAGTLDPIAAEGAKGALRREVAETVAHELGHVIQFEALGLYNFKGSDVSPHMNGMSHTLQSLTNPEFAFVEGWGEANSMVITGLPAERSPGAANRIDYSSTVDYLNAAIKQAESTGDARLADLKKAKAYVDGLQAKKGSLRTRYDFLRSEYAVAGTLAKLRRELGLEAAGDVLRTLAKHKPRTLAALIERFVADYPARKAATYRVLAKATEGILVTEAQADAVERAAAAGRALEIDIDQDGRVPGTSANEALPDAFPRDMPLAGQEPLPAGQQAGTAVAATTVVPESVVFAENPAWRRTIPLPTEPDMEGLEQF